MYIYIFGSLWIIVVFASHNGWVPIHQFVAIAGTIPVVNHTRPTMGAWRHRLIVTEWGNCYGYVGWCGGAIIADWSLLQSKLLVELFSEISRVRWRNCRRFHLVPCFSYMFFCAFEICKVYRLQSTNKDQLWFVAKKIAFCWARDHRPFTVPSVRASRCPVTLWVVCCQAGCNTEPTKRRSRPWNPSAHFFLSHLLLAKTCIFLWWRKVEAMIGNEWHMFALNVKMKWLVQRWGLASFWKMFTLW